MFEFLNKNSDSFYSWGVHNCQPEEAVGIVCKTAVNTCQEGHWKCDKSPACIPTAFICDEVVDCPDGSDESAGHCDVSRIREFVNVNFDIQKFGRLLEVTIYTKIPFSFALFIFSYFIRLVFFRTNCTLHSSIILLLIQPVKVFIARSNFLNQHRNFTC